MTSTGRQSWRRTDVIMNWNHSHAKRVPPDCERSSYSRYRSPTLCHSCLSRSSPLGLLRCKTKLRESGIELSQILILKCYLFVLLERLTLVIWQRASLNVWDDTNAIKHHRQSSDVFVWRQTVSESGRLARRLVCLWCCLPGFEKSMCSRA